MGKRILLLLSLLILLIIYTVYTFNYKTILSDDEMANSPLPGLDTTSDSTIMDNIGSIKDKVIGLVSNSEENKSDETTMSSVDTQSNDLVVDEKSENSNIPVEKKDIEVVPEEETVDKNLDASNEELKDEITTEINKEVLQSKINEILSKNKLVFKRRSTNLTDNSLKSVEKISKILKENSNFKVEIAGHTDSRGSAQLNKRISKKRANSVMNLLIKQGVDKSILKAVGYGEDFPIAKDDEDGLSPINRRVEINIIGEN